MQRQTGGGTRAPGRFRSGLLVALLFPVYLLLWLVAIHYLFFWRPFVGELRERDRPKAAGPPMPRHVDALTAQRLGDVQFKRRSSFIHFDEAKAPGTIRLCAFGDSFTYGSEAADGHDYPALLQAELRAAGLERAEVINFASGWHGFHQAYMMWDGVGRRFGCDYVLLGPRCFQYQRDTTFNHSQLNSPYFLHARYVLDGDDVRLLEVPGETYAHRFADYFRYLPRWQYLRYDRNLAPTVQAVLPASRTLPNPFYYYPGSMEAEAVATYAHLLRRLAAEAPHTLLLHDTPAVVDAGQRAGRDTLLALPIYSTVLFPYRAPEDHYSAAGNQLVARQFLARLVEGGPEHLTVLKTTDPPPRPVPSPAPAPPAVSSYDSIEVRLGEQPVGFLSTRSADTFRTGVGSPSALKDAGVVALFGVKDTDESWVDAVWVEVEFPLQADQPVVLSVGSGSARRDFPLGSLRQPDPRLSFGGVDLPEVWFSEQEGFVFCGNDVIPRRALGEAGGACEVRIGDRVVLEGEIDDEGAKLLPVRGPARSFRVGTAQFVEVDALPEQGQFDLVLAAGAETMRVPLALWTKTAVSLPRAQSALPGRIELPPPDA